MQFILGQVAKGIEEDLHIEFKEITGGNPANSIKSMADDYAVAFLNREGGSVYWGIRNGTGEVIGIKLSAADRDDVRKGIENKLRNIQPQIPPSHHEIDFHTVENSVGTPIPDLYVVELDVPSASPTATYASASGNGSFTIWQKTFSGKLHLSWSETQELVVSRRRLDNPERARTVLEERVTKLLQMWPPPTDLAYLTLVARPIASDRGLLAQAFGEDQPLQVLTKLAVRGSNMLLNGANFSPDISIGSWVQRNLGWSTLNAESTDRNPRGVADMVIEADGSAYLFCGHAAQRMTGDLAPRMALIEDLIVGLTVKAFAVVGGIYKRAEKGGALIDVGLAIDGLAGERVFGEGWRARSHPLAFLLSESVTFDSDFRYREAHTVRASELAYQPVKVARLLAGPLLGTVTRGVYDPFPRQREDLPIT